MTDDLKIAIFVMKKIEEVIMAAMSEKMKERDMVEMIRGALYMCNVMATDETLRELRRIVAFQPEGRERDWLLEMVSIRRGSTYSPPVVMRLAGDISK